MSYLTSLKDIKDMDMEDSTTDHEDVGNYCVSVREGRDLKDISDNSCKKLSVLNHA